MANPQQKSNREHSFDSELASLVGIEKAILVKNIAYWVDENERRKIESSFAYGKWWTFESLTSLSIKYPYMKRGNLSRWFKELKRDGWIVMFSTTDGSNMYAPGPVFNAWNIGKDWQVVFQNETGRAWGEVFQNEPKATAQNEIEAAAQNETHNNVESNIEKDIELEGEREAKKLPPPTTFDEMIDMVNEQAEQLKALKPTPKTSCSISCSPSDFCEGGKCDRNGCYESEPLLVQSVDAETLPGAIIKTAEILTGMNTDGETGIFVTHKQESQAQAYLTKLKITAKASTEKEAREEIIKWCEANPEQVKWSYESARRTLTKSDLTETIIAFSGHYATTSEVGKQLLFFSDPARMFQNGLTKWLQTQNKFDREQSAKAQKAPYQQPEQKYVAPQKPTPPQPYYD